MPPDNTTAKALAVRAKRAVHGLLRHSFGRTALLRMGAGALYTGGNPLHFILAVELHFLELDFFQQVFRIQVGSCGEFLKFCFVLGVLLCQTLILGVCFQKYVPRVPLRACHWPSLRFVCGYSMNAR